jgi:O-antigen/teichoic acid export membrane protein
MMAICGADFVTRWMGKGNELIIVLMYIGLIATFSNSCQIPTVNFLFGTSRNKFYAAANWIQAILIFVLVMISINLFGLKGVILAVSAVTFVVKMFVQAWGACRAIKISLWDYHIQHTLPNVLKPMLYLAVVFLIAGYLLEPTYLRVFSVAGVSVILYLPYIFFVGFDERERGKFLEAVGLNKAKLQ